VNTTKTGTPSLEKKKQHHEVGDSPSRDEFPIFFSFCTTHLARLISSTASGFTRDDVSPGSSPK
jgi:hypothetical protein